MEFNEIFDLVNKTLHVKVCLVFNILLLHPLEGLYTVLTVHVFSHFIITVIPWHKLQLGDHFFSTITSVSFKLDPR